MKKKEIFLILETFPGQKELRESTRKKLLKRFAQVDFVYLCSKIQKASSKIDINVFEEELWWKFLSFSVLAEEFLSNKNIDILNPSTKLTVKSAKESKLILEKFNKKFHKGKNIIQNISGITLDELVEFAKSGEPLV